MKRSLYVLLAILLPVVSIAQRGIRNDGREFYLGLLTPGNVTQVPNGANQFNAFAEVYAVSGATVRFSYFDELGNEEILKVVKVAARQSTQVQLDVRKMRMRDTGEVPEYKACHVVSDAPISLQFLSAGPSDDGSYLALPMQCLGKKYVVMSYHDNVGGLGSLLKHPDDPGANTAGYFLIIATEDGTSVQYAPNVTTAAGKVGAHGYQADGSVRVYGTVLNRGDCYLVKSPASSETDDISGSLVETSRPVVVLAGHENAYTDGSDVGTASVEQRDFMIEQMIPSDCFDTMGYITIPLIDSPPPTSGGTGDEFHIFVANDKTAVATINNAYDINGAYFASTVQGILGISTPAVIHAKNGVPFGAMMYDQRMQTTTPNAANPAPSMTSIVAESGWKSEYALAFPKDTNSTAYQQYYLNIICSSSDWNRQLIQNIYNGKPSQPVQSSGLLVKKTWVVPGGEGLMGAQISVPVSSNCYVYSVPFGADTVRPKFMAYVTGMRNTFGTYSEFSNPAGMACNRIGAPDPELALSVKQNCANWNICAEVKGDSASAVRYVELLNYTNNTFYPTARVAKNIVLDPSLDTLGKGDIIRSDNAKKLCFDVFTPNPADSSYGTIAVYDNSGYVQTVTLNSKPIINAAIAPGMTRIASDTFAFPVFAADSEGCGYIDISALSKNEAIPFGIDSIYVKGDAASMRINPPMTNFPITVQAGQSLRVPICFRPDDTSNYSAQIVFAKECGGTFRFVVQGKGATGLIQATDLAIGATDSNDVNCGKVTISNTGTRPYTLTGAVVSDPMFTVDPAFLATLPKTFAPGDRVDVQVCFKPTDREFHTATITWQTNLSPNARLAAETKNISFLSGQGYDPSVLWSPRSVVLLGDTSKPTLQPKIRVYLTNRGALKRIQVHSITLTGENASEFQITDNEYGLSPLSNFYINVKDSMWVEVQFTPNLTKPYPAKWADRSVFLSALYDIENSGVKNNTLLDPLTGRFLEPDAVWLRPDAPGSLYAVMQEGRILILAANDAHRAFECSLYDLLGRKVADWGSVTPPGDGSYLALPTNSMPSGMYILRLGAATTRVIKR
ncbi:MAG: hypothetical protein JSS75_02170 [Bacteroidetes bacterium]|nr:hypothetical protein [Bacteroidota bacterium]